jgi:hypothetical protein
MKVNAVEIGERYGDDSGWERRVVINAHDESLQIDVRGSSLSAYPRDAIWIIDALNKAFTAVFVEGPK